MNTYQVNIGHLFPDLLNLYGDRGNITSFIYRGEKRNIKVNVFEYLLGDSIDFEALDIVFLGGGSDREQEIVGKTLFVLKDEFKKYIEAGGCVLAVCGGFQLLGNFYMINGNKIPGLSILDIETESKKGRLIGNIVAQTELDGDIVSLVGFENHGGRTNIKDVKPFAKVLKGNGNNGKDGFEGIIYKNVIGTYIHGPLLPKNPEITDYFFKKAIKRKYGVEIKLKKIDDSEEINAKNVMISRIIGEKNDRK